MEWRYSSKNPKLFLIDARASIILYIFILHITFYSLYLLLFISVILIIIEYYKTNIFTLYIIIRHIIFGKRKISYRR